MKQTNKTNKNKKLHDRLHSSGNYGYYISEGCYLW